MRIEVLDSETLTVSTVVKQLTAAKLTSEVTKVRIYVETNTIRYWRSGKDPTTTQGFPLFDTDTLELTLTDATALKMIRVSADASVHVEYIKEHP
jgi:hypothetical protein